MLLELVQRQLLIVLICHWFLEKYVCKTSWDRGNKKLGKTSLRSIGDNIMIC